MYSTLHSFEYIALALWMVIRVVTPMSLTVMLSGESI